MVHLRSDFRSSSVPRASVRMFFDLLYCNCSCPKIPFRVCALHHASYDFPNRGVAWYSGGAVPTNRFGNAGMDHRVWCRDPGDGRSRQRQSPSVQEVQTT